MIQENLVNVVSQLLSSTDPKESRLTELSCLLLHLKEINRDAYSRLKDIKRCVQQERQIFDEKSIALQSVQYQRKHLESEIEACRQLETKYDRIVLVPIEEFKVDKMDTDEILDEHSLTLARLNDELFRRKKMMDDVKLAEIKRNAEKEKLAKLKRDLENLRDHAKTIYKMASSYKLVPVQPVPAKGEGVDKLKEEAGEKSPLQKLFDEIVSFVGEDENWSIKHYNDIGSEGSNGNGEDDEEGMISTDPDDTEAIQDDDGTGDKEESAARHHHHHQETSKVGKRLFDFEYLEIVPPLDIFDGTITLYHQTKAKNTPVVMTVNQNDIESSEQFLKGQLNLDSSLLLCVDASEGMVAFKWVQVAAGLASDMAFSDTQRCLSSFFEALKTYQEAHQKQYQLSTDDLSCSQTPK